MAQKSRFIRTRYVTFDCGGKQTEDIPQALLSLPYFKTINNLHHDKMGALSQKNVYGQYGGARLVGDKPIKLFTYKDQLLCIGHKGIYRLKQEEKDFERFPTSLVSSPIKKITNCKLEISPIVSKENDILFPAIVKINNTYAYIAYYDTIESKIRLIKYNLQINEIEKRVQDIGSLLNVNDCRGIYLFHNKKIGSQKPIGFYLFTLNNNTISSRKINDTEMSLALEDPVTVIGSLSDSVIDFKVTENKVWWRTREETSNPTSSNSEIWNGIPEDQATDNSPMFLDFIGAGKAVNGRRLYDFHDWLGFSIDKTDYKVIWSPQTGFFIMESGDPTGGILIGHFHANNTPLDIENISDDFEYPKMSYNGPAIQFWKRSSNGTHVKRDNDYVTDFNTETEEQRYIPIWAFPVLNQKQEEVEILTQEEVEEQEDNLIVPPRLTGVKRPLGLDLVYMCLGCSRPEVEEINGQMLIGGGALSYYDGSKIVEYGFSEKPVISVKEEGGNPSPWQHDTTRYNRIILDINQVEDEDRTEVSYISEKKKSLHVPKPDSNPFQIVIGSDGNKKGKSGSQGSFENRPTLEKERADITRPDSTEDRFGPRRTYLNSSAIDEIYYDSSINRLTIKIRYDSSALGDYILPPMWRINNTLFNIHSDDSGSPVTSGFRELYSYTNENPFSGADGTKVPVDIPLTDEYRNKEDLDATILDSSSEMKDVRITGSIYRESKIIKYKTVTEISEVEDKLTISGSYQSETEEEGSLNIREYIASLSESADRADVEEVFLSSWEYSNSNREIFLGSILEGDVDWEGKVTVMRYRPTSIVRTYITSYIVFEYTDSRVDSVSKLEQVLKSYYKRIKVVFLDNTEWIEDIDNLDLSNYDRVVESSNRGFLIFIIRNSSYVNSISGTTPGAESPKEFVFYRDVMRETSAITKDPDTPVGSSYMQVYENTYDTSPADIDAEDILDQSTVIVGEEEDDVILPRNSLKDIGDNKYIKDRVITGSQSFVRILSHSDPEQTVRLFYLKLQDVTTTLENLLKSSVYKYVCVFKWVDNLGNEHRSQWSNPINVLLGPQPGESTRVIVGPLKEGETRARPENFGTIITGTPTTTNLGRIGRGEILKTAPIELDINFLHFSQKRGVKIELYRTWDLNDTYRQVLLKSSINSQSGKSIVGGDIANGLIKNGQWEDETTVTSIDGKASFIDDIKDNELAQVILPNKRILNGAEKITSYQQRFVIYGFPERKNTILVSSEIDPRKNFGVAFNDTGDDATSYSEIVLTEDVLQVIAMDQHLVIFTEKKVYAWTLGSDDATEITGATGVSLNRSGLTYPVTVNPLGAMYISTQNTPVTLFRGLSIKTHNEIKLNQNEFITEIVNIDHLYESRFLLNTGKILVYNYRHDRWSEIEPPGTGEIVSQTYWKGKWTYINREGAIYTEETISRESDTRDTLQWNFEIVTGDIQPGSIRGFYRIRDYQLIGKFTGIEQMVCEVTYEGDQRRSKEVLDLNIENLVARYNQGYIGNPEEQYDPVLADDINIWQFKPRRQKCSSLRLHFKIRAKTAEVSAIKLGVKVLDDTPKIAGSD